MFSVGVSWASSWPFSGDVLKVLWTSEEPFNETKMLGRFWNIWNKIDPRFSKKFFETKLHLHQSNECKHNKGYGHWKWNQLNQLQLMLTWFDRVSPSRGKIPPPPSFRRHSAFLIPPPGSCFFLSFFLLIFFCIICIIIFSSDVPYLASFIIHNPYEFTGFNPIDTNQLTNAIHQGNQLNISMPSIQLRVNFDGSRPDLIVIRQLWFV